MEQNDKYIEQLLERFFDGLTSNEEEQLLYKYFAKDNIISPHLEKYRSVVQYFKDDLEDELKIKFSEDELAIAGISERSQSNTLLKRWVIGISAVAASLLLLFFTNPLTPSEEFNPYEGSYVKKDGVVIYDKSEIEEEQARIELFVEQKLACLDKPFLEADEQLEEYEDLNDRMEQMMKEIK